MFDTLLHLIVPLLAFGAAAWAVVQAWRDCRRLLPARPHLRPVVRRLYGLSPLLLLVMAVGVGLWVSRELTPPPAPAPASSPASRESLSATPVTTVMISLLLLAGIFAGTIRVLSDELLLRLGGGQGAGTGPTTPEA